MYKSQMNLASDFFFPSFIQTKCFHQVMSSENVSPNFITLFWLPQIFFFSVFKQKNTKLTFQGEKCI